MSQAKGFSDKVAFIWAVADLLRGDFKAHEYGQVIESRRGGRSAPPTLSASPKPATPTESQTVQVELHVTHPCSRPNRQQASVINGQDSHSYSIPKTSSAR